MEKLAQVPDIGGYIQSPAIVLATSQPRLGITLGFTSNTGIPLCISDTASQPQNNKLVGLKDGKKKRRM